MKQNFNLYKNINVQYIDLHLIFEKLSLKNQVVWTCLVQTWILQATQASKIKFKLDKQSSSTYVLGGSQSIFQNQVQINRGIVYMISARKNHINSLIKTVFTNMYLVSFMRQSLDRLYFVLKRQNRYEVHKI